MNNQYNTNYNENLVTFPLNLLFVNGNLDPAKGFASIAPLLEAV